MTKAEELLGPQVETFGSDERVERYQRAADQLIRDVVRESSQQRTNREREEERRCRYAHWRKGKLHRLDRSGEVLHSQSMGGRGVATGQCRGAAPRPSARAGHYLRVLRSRDPG